MEKLINYLWFTISSNLYLLKQTYKDQFIHSFMYETSTKWNELFINTVCTIRFNSDKPWRYFYWIWIGHRNLLLEKSIKIKINIFLFLLCIHILHLWNFFCFVNIKSYYLVTFDAFLLSHFAIWKFNQLPSVCNLIESIGEWQGYWTNITLYWKLLFQSLLILYFLPLFQHNLF